MSNFAWRRIVIGFDNNRAIDFSVTNHSLEALKFLRKTSKIRASNIRPIILNVIFYGNIDTHTLHTCRMKRKRYENVNFIKKRELFQQRSCKIWGLRIFSDHTLMAAFLENNNNGYL
ncbi:unnamed protein product [Lasius platythorax]|uniref:Uncharacterized protein n=1 Tax=Lasius platythorax TaxID=488582 RepID=A0AAV2NHX7_9HYME